MRNEHSTPRSPAPDLNTSKIRSGSSDKPSAVPVEESGLRSALQDVPVLLVEDDIPSARLQGFLLYEAGAEVRVVHSAEEALAALQSFQPRLVVVDLILPRMSGLLLVQQLKADLSRDEMVFVAVTAMNGPEAQRMVLAAGFSAYIRKPIDVETFAATVARTLEKKS
jgi:CheY-like chemotaxis protein